MKRDEQACTAVPFHDGLAEHLTQIARIIHTELHNRGRYGRAHCAAHGCFALVDE